MMTTGILDALMRLFALFASGRSAREAWWAVKLQAGISWDGYHAR